MSRSPRLRPTGAAALLGVLIGALSLVGCGAGQITQTSSQVAAVDGANAGAGSIAVRNASIELGDESGGGNVYPRGADAPLRMSIANSGTVADRLVSASSPAAGSVEITGDDEIPAGQALVVEGEPAPSPSPTPSPTPSGTPGATPVSPTVSPSPTVSATPTPTRSPSPTPGPGEPGSTASIVLVDLRDDIRAGLTYEVVLTFERAGEVRLDVPVATSDEPREDEPAE